MTLWPWVIQDSCGWEHPEPIHQWSGIRPRTEGVLPIVIGILTADSRDMINSKVKEVYLPNLCGSVSWIVNVHRPWAGGSLFGKTPSRRKQAGARLQACFWSSLISHLSIFLKRNPQKGISPCIHFWYDPWWLLLQVELLMRSKVIGPSPRKSPIMRQLPKGSTHKFVLQGKECQRKSCGPHQFSPASPARMISNVDPNGKIWHRRPQKRLLMQCNCHRACNDWFPHGLLGNSRGISIQYWPEGNLKHCSTESHPDSLPRGIHPRHAWKPGILPCGKTPESMARPTRCRGTCRQMFVWGRWRGPWLPCGCSGWHPSFALHWNNLDGQPLLQELPGLLGHMQ